MPEKGDDNRSLLSEMTPGGTIVACLIIALMLLAFWIGVQIGMDIGHRVLF